VLVKELTHEAVPTTATDVPLSQPKNESVDELFPFTSGLCCKCEALTLEQLLQLP
jgi:hypothetical protein